MTRTTEPLAQGRTPRTDEELLAAVRAQQPDAFPDLRDRHWHTAVVVARLHTPSRQDAEQLAGTAFDQVLAELGEETQDEDGPGVFLRARLVAVVGRAGVERASAAGTVTGIYLGLPASWQAVLWHLEVEALGLERTAAVLGLSPAATTALHLEARAGLRAAYRRARQNLPTLAGCADCAADLGAFADGGLPAERTQAVQDHLDECPRCTADHLYLQDTEAGLRGWLLPVLAGVPLWDVRTDEVVELVRAAGRMSAGRLGAAPGTDVAGGALAAVHVTRRGRKVLLGAGALAAAAALAGIVVTGSGGPGDGTTQATVRLGGSGATDPSAPAASAPAASAGDDGAATMARGAGAAVPGGAGGVLSLPTSEPSPGPLTEAAAEARTAGAGGGTITTAATTDGPAAGSREAAADAGASTGRRTEAAPSTRGSVQDDGRAPRPAAAGGRPSDSGTPGGSSAAGGGTPAPPPAAADDGSPAGEAPVEQPPAAGPTEPRTPVTESPGTEPPAEEVPAPETPAPETPGAEQPPAESPAPEAPEAPASEPPATAPAATVPPAEELPSTGATEPGNPSPEPGAGGATPPTPGG
ncbi:zf-HC2 domain-containing protein [Kocuria rosea]|uniref:zf-HC2 domain-containing protein n=1 Tax=Kocuria rosea TaxID=1275 RepID=UPI0025B765BD|nr:zf-HC2 domain-containing protein [Kocuria rosea]WJZ67573.1 zf-HC2 domain-containing protein [Kocuria rosea]